MPKVNNALLKNTNGKGKLQKMLSLLLPCGKRQNSESPKDSKLVFYILLALFLIAAIAAKFIKNFQVYFINYVQENYVLL